ncbi:hypothetical protein J0J37_21910, partial [Vibrio vulnificus]|uniref:hypothetical protein n=1 Tax=Vibrio vulnificus TaxID=672 RepID=UPI0019D4D053
RWGMSARLSTKVCSYVLSTFCGVHQLNQVKSVVYGFSLFPQLVSLMFVGKLAFVCAIFWTSILGR